ncbi:MAG: hypothetical protein N3E50_03270, partial [Candidatus Goldbacteria bacterium]|nr:hypothetical protein [Candidatus Goldiibacteriota bacterium]
GVVEKSGTWFTYNGVKLGQGREAAIKYLTDNPKILEEIEQKTRDKYFGKEKAEEKENKEEKKANVVNAKDIKPKVVNQ